jgi:hypothetical protein
VPQRPETEDLIQREGYRWLWQLEGSVTPENAGGLLEEAERALGYCPSADFASVHKARALRVLGLHTEAETARRMARSLPAVAGGQGGEARVRVDTSHYHVRHGKFKPVGHSQGYTLWTTVYVSIDPTR